MLLGEDETVGAPSCPREVREECSTGEDHRVLSRGELVALCARNTVSLTFPTMTPDSKKNT